MSTNFDKRDDGWYFTLSNEEHGPYKNLKEAEIDYQWWVTQKMVQGGSCPTCGDE